MPWPVPWLRGVLLMGASHAMVADGQPRVWVTPAEGLAASRVRVQEGDSLLKPAMEALKARAHEALAAGPFSVVSDALVPPSGDKHDYMSVGPYWWPNPKTPDGLPYVRRDGEVNPEREDGDNTAMAAMVGAVKPLALAYFLTREERYAERASRLLRTWFLDPETRMNPNLEYGQAVPGRCEGRGIGIIDTTCLIGLVDREGLLQDSPHWPDADHAAMVAWFRAYLGWLRTSSHGRSEERTKNNHGSWYDAQVAAFALFVGDTRLARKTVAAAGQRRIAKQVRKDGSQPHELARTKSWNYSIYNLTAFTVLASLGRHVGVDLWDFKTDDGRGIREALSFLTLHIDPDRPWPHRQITPRKNSSLLGLLLAAAYGYGDGAYWQLIDKLPDGRRVADELMLLYPPPPGPTH